MESGVVLTAYLGVPYNSDPAPGVDKGPATLREAGLLEDLRGLTDVGDLQLARDPIERRDPETGYLAPGSLLAAAQTIRRTVEHLLAAAERPLLIGGDCALLIGVFAAIRDHGERTGLVFIDGHVDFYDPKDSPTGEAADSELAVLTGHGPRGFIDLAGPPPLVNPADVVVLGFRDQADWPTFGAVDPAILEPQLRLVDLDEVRRRGFEQTGRDTAASLARRPGRFWLHLDLDVLSTTALPAVDYPMEGGLDWDELMQLTRPLAMSPALVGMDVTIYNPELDPNRLYAPRIVRFLSNLLAVSAAGHPAPAGPS